MRIWFVLVLVCGLAACGDSPTPISPSPVTPAPTLPSVAGPWQGTMQVGVGQLSITMALTQDGRTVSGRWQAASGDPHGTVTGTLAGDGTETVFSGVLTFDSPSDQSAVRCLGSADFAGPASATRLQWSAPRLASQNCAPREDRFTVLVVR